MARYLRIAMILVLALTIVLSCTVMGTRLTDPETYEHTIEVLDKNRVTVLGLSAASAAASAAISALPEDICTPLAEEISEFTTWFLMILSVIYLEKYLLTIFGAVACYLLIPAGSSALLVNCFYPKTFLKSIGTKLVALGAALLLVIPTSVWISDQINAIYEKSIAITMESAGAVSENLIGEIAGENDENTSVIDEAKEFLSDISGSVAVVVDQFKNVLNRFVEATAVMVVTTCLIPILVIMFFGWIVKTLFGIPVVIPTAPSMPKRKPLPYGTEAE